MTTINNFVKAAQERAEAILAERKQKEQAKAEAEEAQHAAAAKEAIAALETELSTRLGADLLAALTPEYTWIWAGEPHVAARLHYGQHEWHLRPSHVYASTWMVELEGDELYHDESHTYNPANHPLDLRTWLVLVMSETHEKRIEKERRDQAKDAQRKAERAALETAQHIEDAECRAEIAERLAQEQARLWRWPDGVAITLYYWTFQRGRDSDGEAEYDTEWAVVDHLDSQGYVRFLDDRGRSVRLIPEVHMPIIERITFTCTDDCVRLTDDRLEERITVSLPYHRSDYDKKRLSHCTNSSHNPNSYGHFRLDVGIEPHQWLRDLVDAAANN